MMHAMLETVITAHGLKVDPFDQPAVERGKQLTRRYLSGDGS
jgi:glucose-6-phosphate isomerase